MISNTTHKMKRFTPQQLATTAAARNPANKDLFKQIEGESKEVEVIRAGSEGKAARGCIVTVNIKPLSVNDAWQGQRFKTKEYKAFEKELLFRLPPISLPAPPYKIYFEFGLSNAGSDYDNPIKPLQDILGKKYRFNDNQIAEATIKKVRTEIGKEYFSFKIEHYELPV